MKKLTLKQRNQLKRIISACGDFDCAEQKCSCTFCPFRTSLSCLLGEVIEVCTDILKKDNCAEVTI